MIVSEYHGKGVLRRAGIAVPRGVVAQSPEQAASVAATLRGRVAIKAQVPAGKRGKAGGIRFAADPDEAERVATDLLASNIGGFSVRKLLVEERIEIASEFYAAVMNDATSKSPLMLFTREGGVDIEELSASRPYEIARHVVDIRRGFTHEDAHAMLADAGVEAPLREPLAGILTALYAQYHALDLELLEINPLAVDKDGRLWALDCKLSVDDAAKPRQAAFMAEIEGWLGETGTQLERRGRAEGLLYIELDGDVGVLANGAGLTMATIDAVAHHGGRPANFLEIGGDAYTKATRALELVLANSRIKSIVVNFCGAFARTDVMTEGVIRAIEALRPRVPMFFSIHGTGEEEAQAMLRRSLGIASYDLMDDAVRAAVAEARTRSVVEVPSS